MLIRNSVNRALGIVMTVLLGLRVMNAMKVAFSTNIRTHASATLANTCPLTTRLANPVAKTAKSATMRITVISATPHSSPPPQENAPRAPLLPNMTRISRLVKSVNRTIVNNS